MPRKTAGRKYPFTTTAAKEHNHTMCPVVEAIARKVVAGDEAWGTLHTWNVVSEADAKAAVKGFYAARYCKELKGITGEWMSIRASYEIDQDGETYVVRLQVWPRSVARAEIVRRIQDGEPLAYNPMKPR